MVFVAVTLPVPSSFKSTFSESVYIHESTTGTAFLLLIAISVLLEEGFEWRLLPEATNFISCPMNESGTLIMYVANFFTYRYVGYFPVLRIYSIAPLFDRHTPAMESRP